MHSPTWKSFIKNLSRQHIVDQLEEDDVVGKQRFYLFRIFTLSGILVCFCVVFKMLSTIPNAGILPWLILTLSSIMLSNYFLLKNTKHFSRAYNILMWTVFLLLHIVAYSCGGIRTGGLLYHGVIILYAYHLLGIKGGRVFTLLFALNVVYFYCISTFTNWTSFAMFKEDDDLISQDFLVNALFSFFLIARQGNYLQSGKNVIIQGLEKSKRELEIKNQELEEKNEMLKKYTVKLEKSNSELDKFASVASHDLKAPLRAIGTLTDFIAMDLEDSMNEELKKNIGTIKGRVHRMEALLDALLHYSRADRRLPQLCNINTSMLLENIIEGIKTKRNYKIQIQNSLPEIYADEKVIKAVFEIFIDNAIKFNDKEQAEIQITSLESDEEWLFSVRDNGQGIDAKFHEKVFIIFQTLNARDSFESTGAGLAIAKKIIENQQGRVYLNSVPGEGAEFGFAVKKTTAKAYRLNQESVLIS